MHMDELKVTALIVKVNILDFMKCILLLQLSFICMRIEFIVGIANTENIV